MFAFHVLSCTCTTAPGPFLNHGHDIDALLPGEIARRAEIIGAQKARMEFGSLIVLAILAGAFIGLGAMFATTVLAGAEGVLPFLGLILVVIGGAELDARRRELARTDRRSATPSG